MKENGIKGKLMNDLSSRDHEQLPMFAIVIAVNHSIACLEYCLKSLGNLDYPKALFRVVLVDCHLIDGLKDFLADKLAGYPVHVTRLELPKTQQRLESWLKDARVNEARNAAIQKVPAQYYVFTEDDCMVMPDWLTKFAAAFEEGISAAGGPDILPEGMGWFAKALDYILNSYLGTAGLKRGDRIKKNWYYPRHQNMAVSAKAIGQIGKFPEEMTLEGEIEMAKRLLDAGLKIKYLNDNPVWHRRETTYLKFLKRNEYQAAEKVKLLRRRQAFFPSPYFPVLLVIISGIFLALLSLVNMSIRTALLTLICCYILLVLFAAGTSALRNRRLTVGLGVILLMPSHHLSLALGILRGAFSRPTN